jgi:CRP-like cAMP-binding protein
MKSALHNLPFLKGVEAQTLQGLAQNNHITQRTYYKDATVHKQGSVCHMLDVVLSGKLAACALAASGSQTVLFEFAKNSVVGANLLFGEQNTYPVDITCTADCTVVHITKQGVEQLLDTHAFVMRFIRSLSLNSQQMNQKIAMHAQKSLRENLTDYLLALSTEQKSDVLNLPVTKKQLADYLGVQRPSLFREFKRMKQEGLIAVENKTVTIKKPLCQSE